uniref:Uncharacterized protein n=1 Tax=Macrostomum lignano TaxID=282301 RepID=A0A1I8FQG9_9PLAT
MTGRQAFKAEAAMRRCPVRCLPTMTERTAMASSQLPDLALAPVASARPRCPKSPRTVRPAMIPTLCRT